MFGQSAAPIQLSPVRACTISQDIGRFSLLVEDIEREFSGDWADYSLAEAPLILAHPASRQLQFVCIAVGGDDEAASAIATIRAAQAQKIGVIVVSDQMTPAGLHQLLRLGAVEFLPYPIPAGALHDAVERLLDLRTFTVEPPLAQTRRDPKRSGVVLGVQGLAGGVGATNFAVTLAWELARIDKPAPQRVCLLDLDLQHGSVATYLDLTRREIVFEALADTSQIDDETFDQTLQCVRERLYVLTSPADLVPLDLLTEAGVIRLLELVRANFDYIVIDLPKSFLVWTERVLREAQVYFAVMEKDMRCAQTAIRVLRALKSEDLPIEKIRFVLNRAPGRFDFTGKSRIRRIADSLDISLDLQLPDGGKEVVQANDQGEPLAELFPRNPLRRVIQKLARSIHDVNQPAARAA